MLLKNGKNKKSEKKNVGIQRRTEKDFYQRKSLDDAATLFDPLGMYTGVPEDRYDKPVQDADDL